METKNLARLGVGCAIRKSAGLCEARGGSLERVMSVAQLRRSRHLGVCWRAAAVQSIAIAPGIAIRQDGNIESR